MRRVLYYEEKLTLQNPPPHCLLFLSLTHSFFFKPLHSSPNSQTKSNSILLTNLHLDHKDFVLGFKKIVDYFDIAEFNRIWMFVNSCFNLSFKTLMSSLARGVAQCLSKGNHILC